MVGPRLGVSSKAAQISSKLLTEVSAYYSSKLLQHGATPQGVDWNSEESQLIRFKQLSKIIVSENNFSVLDLGCGYGAFFDYLLLHYPAFAYLGTDISADMIQAAKNRHKNNNQATFVQSDKPTTVTDYGIASGIFNVRLSSTNEEWSSYLENTLDLLNGASRFGFAFNCLTSYSDTEKMRDYLYYANPGALFDFCKRRYSKNIALLHDYGLYEFTILVKKC